MPCLCLRLESRSATAEVGWQLDSRGGFAKVRPMELYEQWLETCAENRDAWALRDLGTGAEWTFAALADELKPLPKLSPGSIASAAASEGAVTFLLKTLQAWRDGAVLLPVERADAGEVERDALPAESIVHIKTTSGSTGKPRRVLFRAAQLAADWRQIRSTMGLTRAAPDVAVLSLARR